MSVSCYFMSSLCSLHKLMKEKNTLQVTFPFEYNSKPFSCIFVTNVIPYRLYMSTLGKNPLTFEFEIKTGYKIDIKISSEQYYLLLQYLQLKYSPNHKFKPIDLFNKLNKMLPFVKIYKVKTSSLLKIVSQVRTIEEAEKIYFIGWRHLPKGQKVSPLNFQKTQIAFGNKIAEICQKNNISSCWSPISSEEKAVDFSSLYI